jgi:hypothetical protein
MAGTQGPQPPIRMGMRIAGQGASSGLAAGRARGSGGGAMPRLGGGGRNPLAGGAADAEGNLPYLQELADSYDRSVSTMRAPRGPARRISFKVGRFGLGSGTKH